MSVQIKMSTRRRNGQLPSCEPCRVSKLRCDHSFPICGRCSRKEQADKCIYHPAPMTRPRQPAEAAQRPVSEATVPLPSSKKRKYRSSFLATKGSTGSTGFLQQYRVPPPPIAASTYGPLEKNNASHLREQEYRKEARMTKLAKRSSVFSTGFLGPSSYWSAFEESGESNRIIAPMPTPSPDQQIDIMSSADLAEEDVDISTVDPEQIESGVKILTLLDDLPLFQNLLRVRCELCRPWLFGEGIIEQVVSILFALRNEWIPPSNGGSAKHAKSQKSNLRAASKRIFANSVGSVASHRNMTVSEYFAVATHRWETIGVMFSWVTIATMIIPEGHECLRLENGTTIDLNALGLLGIEVAETCLGFCDKVGTMSDPLSWLLLQHAVSLTATYGDSDYRPWRKMGELSTVVFALGLHRPKLDDSSAPLFLLEVRRRVMAGALMLDKQLATLLGRPPRIAWQYCDIEMPLDVTYEDVFAASDAQDESIVMKQIGTDGWNIDGKYTSGTQARLYMMHAIMREKILSLSLAPHPDDIARKISETCEEQDRLQSSLPETLQWKPSSGPRITDPKEDFLTNMHLEFLNNNFILYRVLVKRAGIGKEKLLKVAREMLSATLTLASRAAAWISRNGSIWNLCFIGLPCAGVLAQELLRRMQSGSLDLSPFPRSEVIQNLSVFASYLSESCDPQDGNHEIAVKGLNAIRNVLDHVLADDHGFVVHNSKSSENILGDYGRDVRSALTPSTIGGSRSIAQPISTTEHPPNGPAVEQASSAAVPGWFMDDAGGMEFMTWLDNLDWGQESLLSYSWAEPAAR